jgi:Cu2+-exporting ATPase
MVVVQAGQVIPVDGTITRGIATIDQHLLTGEAQPIEKGGGDSVLAATVVLTGAIHIRVEKAGHEISAAQMVDILNRTATYQMSMESKALAIADRAALPTLALGALAWPVAGWRGAMAVLGLNVGSSMRMLGPLAMLNYLNILSRNSILVKDGRSLELLNEVDTIVFDKTGTLTLEQPHVAEVHPCAGWCADELLTLAATAEQRQTHPIARAILTAARARGLKWLPLENAHYEVGFGIKVQMGGRIIRVGSPRFMEMEGIASPDAMRQRQQVCAEQGHSLVMVAVDGQLGGALELHATVRPEVKQVIRGLRERNLALYILSGDQEAPTRRLAHELGIDHYIANVLPEDKAQVIEELQQKEKSVCFIGDGINDGIALKKAHVSVSLCGATTVATDAAQIVLMDQSLHQLGYLLDIADEFESTFRRCLASSVVPDAILVGSVFLLHFGLVASALCFSAGIAAGVANAMWPALKHSSRNESRYKRDLRQLKHAVSEVNLLLLQK